MPWQNDPESRARSNRLYGAPWRKARDACLKRARWRCEIRTEGICIGAASQVDHIDGVDNDPQHKRLRAACAPCHARVTAQQGGGFRAAGSGRDPAPQPRTAW
jgi:5-methylcytosine-specific restriction endonuclease McrA